MTLATKIMIHFLAFLLFLALLFHFVPLHSDATTDLNKHQLRYVADHLTNSECKKLYEALQMKKFDLDHHVTGKGQPQVPCIVLLQYWDKVQAKKADFSVLTLRLREIGRDDLADKLSESVMKEKADAAEKAVNGKSMQKLIVTNSPILLDSPKDHPSFREKDAQQHQKPPGWSAVHTGAILSIATNVFLIFLLFAWSKGWMAKWKKQFWENVRKEQGKEKKNKDKKDSKKKGKESKTDAKAQDAKKDEMKDEKEDEKNEDKKDEEENATENATENTPLPV